MKIKDINWLWVAAGGTVVYLIVLTSWIGTAKLSAFLRTDHLNEFGDFLAGVFAPLAFLWLIAAVITQRQELNETRDQFEENQKVVDAQMKTISSQNALLALQHNQARESAIQTYKLNLFDKRFTIYDELRLIGLQIKNRGSVEAKDYELIKNLSHQASFVFRTEVERYLENLCELVEDHLHDVSEWKSTWDDQRYNGLVEPTGPEADEIRNHVDTQYRGIVTALSPNALSNQMWSSLRVSDQ